MDKQYYVYILTNKRNNVLYTGVTNDLQRRVYENREKLVSGFTKKYNVYKLVYFEVTPSIEAAIQREKQIKGGSRQKKIKLIAGMNLRWRDLNEDLYGVAVTGMHKIAFLWSARPRTWLRSQWCNNQIHRDFQGGNARSTYRFGGILKIIVS